MGQPQFISTWKKCDCGGVLKAVASTKLTYSALPNTIPSVDLCRFDERDQYLAYRSNARTRPILLKNYIKQHFIDKFELRYAVTSLRLILCYSSTDNP